MFKPRYFIEFDFDFDYLKLSVYIIHIIIPAHCMMFLIGSLSF